MLRQIIIRLIAKFQKLQGQVFENFTVIVKLIIDLNIKVVVSGLHGHGLIKSGRNQGFGHCLFPMLPHQPCHRLSFGQNGPNHQVGKREIEFNVIQTIVTKRSICWTVGSRIGRGGFGSFSQFAQDRMSWHFASIAIVHCKSHHRLWEFGWTLSLDIILLKPFSHVCRRISGPHELVDDKANIDKAVTIAFGHSGNDIADDVIERICWSVSL